ncbi:G1 family glutamic endopeptidase [Streptacidiphilus albus]|uniref:G1 family glutamic endopeptidase n=1 Tax=Streptacidiphilus albus TaxID=105425 RepID=UPI00068F57B2|nr:G1 family glutamic endopeptidase [Streptacidiphilus albus]
MAKTASACLLVIGATLVALGSPAAANAATERPATGSTTGIPSTGPAHSLVRHAGADNSWGGYAVTGGTYHSVTGNWTVPALNCSATAGDISFWSGLDGWTSSTVEQIGLDAVCTKSGQVQYNPWVEMYPANSIYFSEPIEAGDTMTSSVVTNGSGSFTLVLADPTRGWTKTYTKSLKSAALSSAEVIVEAIGSQDIPPCPDFSSIQFTDVTANGGTFAGAGTVNSTNLERNGVLLTQDGALDGTSFPVGWLHA